MPIVGSRAEFSIHVDNVAPFDGLEIPIAMRKGVRSCIQHMITNHPTYTMLSTQYRAYHKIDSIEILKDIHSVLQYRHWKVAVLEETYALSGNDTWEIVDLPKDQRTVGCRWVYTLNYKSDGTIEGYKVRLVAQSFSQTFIKDYDKTFAPVVKMSSLKCCCFLRQTLTRNTSNSRKECLSKCGFR